MELVTVYCPLTTTGVGELVLQAAPERFVVDCKLNPVAVFVHVKITLVPERMIAKTGNGPAEKVPAVSVPAGTPTFAPEEEAATARFNGGLDPQLARE